MTLPCSLWSNSAWEAFQISASLMAIEQAASASWMVWVWIILASLTIAKHKALASRVSWEQMALASLTVAKHRALASRVTQEQMALGSLKDSVAWDSILQSSTPSHQTVLCLQASMDALVASTSSRALLAFSQSSAASAGGVTLPDLVVIATGVMLVGIPYRDASAISALTWDEVSTS